MVRGGIVRGGGVLVVEEVRHLEGSGDFEHEGVQGRVKQHISLRKGGSAARVLTATLLQQHKLNS